MLWTNGWERELRFEMTYPFTAVQQFAGRMVKGEWQTEGRQMLIYFILKYIGHWRTIVLNQVKKLYSSTALHVMTSKIFYKYEDIQRVTVKES